ncbi:MAG TPA: YdeI/OmpD-associated family protein [Aestuariivirgaceae bacterium]|nr:YdeI/OmpD-associated family protein [Aestuariivirgaceae bacterium]
MAILRFTSLIKIRDGNPYIAVSAALAKAVRPGWRKPLPVRVRINGKPAQPWHINMMPAGNGSFYLYLHGDVRKASGTKVGDRVQAEVGFDANYKNGPMHPVPSWFNTALRKTPKAMNNWEALTPSRKKEILRYFARLKSQEACARNLKKALHVLSGKKGRFMGRAWIHGA